MLRLRSSILKFFSGVFPVIQEHSSGTNDYKKLQDEIITIGIACIKSKHPKVYDSAARLISVVNEIGKIEKKLLQVTFIFFLRRLRLSNIYEIGKATIKF